MAHCIVPEVEEILDKEFPVLDKGFVRLVDYMGSDERIVQAARVSYGAGTKGFRKDSGLIDYLMRNRHTSPFEQVVLSFHIKLPIFVARQWIRHRTARVNEISARYSVMKPEFYIPADEALGLQSENNKQGRDLGTICPVVSADIIKMLEDQNEQAFGSYEELLEKGLAREISRMVLPVNLYTEWYWQIDLHNLYHFLSLRLDPHAQLEIRAYAEVILKIVETLCPFATKSFKRYRLGAKLLGSEFDETIKKLLNESEEETEELSALRKLYDVRKN